MTKHISLNTLIPADLHHTRLDAALANLFPDYSRSQLQHWIKEGAISVNDVIAKKTKQLVSADDRIVIEATLKEVAHAIAQDIPLNIVYEDEHLFIINKPVGLVVHPGAGNPSKTLVNALLHYAPEQNHLPRAGIIHRLDKDTSGLLVVAKTLPAHHALVKMMQQRDITREYRALVQGQIISGGTIDAPIGRHATQRTKMAITESGKDAVTHYRVLSRFSHHTLLSVQLETGRTHQIRVHLSHIGYPIVGDTVYGKYRLYSGIAEDVQSALKHFSHQALHAYRLAFTHPITGEDCAWTAELPEDFQTLVTLLSNY